MPRRSRDDNNGSDSVVDCIIDWIIALILGVCLCLLVLLLLAVLFSVKASAGTTSTYCEEQLPLAYQHKSIYQGPYILRQLGDNKGYMFAKGKTQKLITANYMKPLSISPVYGSYARTGIRLSKDAFTMGTEKGINLPNGTQIAVDCLSGIVVVTTLLNTLNTVDQQITYGNVNSSEGIRFHFAGGWPKPWSDGRGKLNIQAYAHRPYYRGYNGHLGGHDIINLMLTPRTGRALINYTIVMYAYNYSQSVTTERISGVPTSNVNNSALDISLNTPIKKVPWKVAPQGIDPNNGAVHVTSHIGFDTVYSTMEEGSTISKYGTDKGWYMRRAAGETPLSDYFNVSIYYEDLQRLLVDICIEDRLFCTGENASPDAWRVKQALIHNELHSSNPNTWAISGSAHGRFQITWYSEDR